MLLFVPRNGSRSPVLLRITPCHQPAILDERCASDIATPTQDLKVFSGSLCDFPICPDLTSDFEDEDTLDWYLEMCFEMFVDDPELHRYHV